MYFVINKIFSDVVFSTILLYHLYLHLEDIPVRDPMLTIFSEKYFSFQRTSSSNNSEDLIFKRSFQHHFQDHGRDPVDAVEHDAVEDE